jgi:hypothetical protein
VHKTKQKCIWALKKYGCAKGRQLKKEAAVLFVLPALSTLG